jgi:probable DNA metabolism protein
MNQMFVYDGTVEGLFSAMDHVLKSRTPSPRFTISADDAGLFDEVFYHVTDFISAKDLYLRIETKINRESLKNIFYCYLSCSYEKEQIIFDYINSGFEFGNKLDRRLAMYPVNEMNKLVSRVKLESHRMLGLVRFSSVEEDTFYAEIEPDNDILPLISGHFSRRMPGEKWIIHDKKRGTAAINQNGRPEILRIELDRLPDCDPCEDIYSGLWKNFYNSIAIKERTNLRLQKQFMPVRYWKHLVEKS